MYDVKKEFLVQGLQSINHSLNKIAKKKFPDQNHANTYVEGVMKRITLATNPEAAAKDADLVIEAIVENLRIKRELFKTLDGIAPSHTIFASNTSSLTISDISSSTNRLDKFGGLHFFNPVPMMKLVEIIHTDQTSQDTIDKLTNFSKSLGKVSVLCKDTPGYIVNRLLVPYLFEGIKMAEAGVASIKDIDTAMVFKRRETNVETRGWLSNGSF
jgi:3-hydroxyacyl-CoA dehydrogenase